MDSSHYSVPICHHKHVDVDHLIHTLQQINLSQCAVHLQQEIAELDKLEDSLAERKRRKESVPDQNFNASTLNQPRSQRAVVSNVISNTSSDQNNRTGKTGAIPHPEQEGRSSIEATKHKTEFISPSMSLFDCFMVASSKNIALEPQYCRKITECQAHDMLRAKENDTRKYSVCELDDTDLEESSGYDFDTTERKIFNQMREYSMNTGVYNRFPPTSHSDVLSSEVDYRKPYEDVTEDKADQETCIDKDCHRSVQIPQCPDIIDFSRINECGGCSFTCKIAGCHSLNDKCHLNEGNEHEKDIPCTRPLDVRYQNWLRGSEDSNASDHESEPTLKKIEEFWRRLTYYCCICYNSKRQCAAPPPNPMSSQPSMQFISHSTSNSTNIYQCNICQHRFAVQSALTKHVREQHASVQLRPKYRCSDCPARFFASRMLVRHFRNQHTEQDDFRPPRCLQNDQARDR